VFLPRAHLHGVPVPNCVDQTEPEVILAALARMLVPTLDRVKFNILCASREGVLLVGLLGHVIIYSMINELNITHGANNALSLF
jgi:hypothetical protein